MAAPEDQKPEMQLQTVRPPVIKDFREDSCVIIWSIPAWAVNFTRLRPDLDYQLALQCDMGKGPGGWEDVCVGDVYSYEFPYPSQHTIYFFRLTVRFIPRPNPPAGSQSLRQHGGLTTTFTGKVETHSSCVFVASQVRAPALCGMGRNVFLEWELPANNQGQHMTFIIEEKQLEDEKDLGDGKRKSIPLGVDVLHFFPVGLCAHALYHFRLRMQYKFGEAPPSPWLQYSTIPPPLTVVSTPEASAAVVGARASIGLEFPPAFDQSGRLATQRVHPSYRLEAKDSKGQWVILHSSPEPHVALTAVPRNTLCPLRFLVTLDLRKLSVEMDKAKAPVLPGDSGSSNSSNSGVASLPAAIPPPPGLHKAEAFYWDMGPVAVALASPAPPSYRSVSSPDLLSLDLKWEAPQMLMPRPDIPSDAGLYAIEYSPSLAGGSFRQVYAEHGVTTVDLVHINNLTLAPPASVVRIRLKVTWLKCRPAYSPILYAIMAPSPLRVTPMGPWPADQRVHISGKGVLTFLRSLPPHVTGHAGLRVHVSIKHHPILVAGEMEWGEDILPVPLAAAPAKGPRRGDEEEGEELGDLGLVFVTRPGRVYKFQLVVQAQHGVAKSGITDYRTEPREPAVPSGLQAHVSVFRSTTGRRSPFLRVQWAQPDSNGYTITAFMVQVRRPLRGKRKRLAAGGQQRAGDVQWEKWRVLYTGMKAYCADVDTLNMPHVTAQYRVRAFNKLGWGKYSEVLQVDQDVAGDMSSSLPWRGTPGLPSNALGSPPNHPSLIKITLTDALDDETPMAIPIQPMTAPEAPHPQSTPLMEEEEEDEPPACPPAPQPTHGPGPKTSDSAIDGAPIVAWNPLADTGHLALASIAARPKSGETADEDIDAAVMDDPFGLNNLSTHLDGVLKGVKDDMRLPLNVRHMRMLTQAALAASSTNLPSLNDLLLARVLLRQQLSMTRTMRGADRPTSTSTVGAIEPWQQPSTEDSASCGVSVISMGGASARATSGSSSSHGAAGRRASSGSSKDQLMDSASLLSYLFEEKRKAARRGPPGMSPNRGPRKPHWVGSKVVQYWQSPAPSSAASASQG